MHFAKLLQSFNVSPRQLALFWLGQAGFAVKNHTNHVIIIDPYLTDNVFFRLRETHGYAFKRLTPPLCEPKELHADYLLISHEHGDHLDLDTVKAIVTKEQTVCYCNLESKLQIDQAGINCEQVYHVEQGQVRQLPDCTLYIVSSDHGTLSPTSVGFILDYHFISIYYAGDTCLNMEVFKQVREFQPDVALLPINGAYGNLNEQEAAEAAAYIGSSLCIPHHFWTFPAHNGNPQKAIDAFETYAPNCRLVLLTPGEPMIVPT